MCLFHVVQVACSFRRKGCMHVGALSQSATHQRDCGFNPANLPEFLLTTESHVGNTSTDDAALGVCSAYSLHFCCLLKLQYTRVFANNKYSMNNSYVFLFCIQFL